MPLVPKAKVAPHQLYGKTKVEPGIGFRDRMRKKFRPFDLVEVRNITDQVLQWQWLDEQDESFTIEDDTNIKIVEREDPGLWELGPGETDYITGSNAYLMLDAQYKMICVRKIGVVLHPLDEREIRNFSLDDPEKQEQFLEVAFVGKVDPSRVSRTIAERNNRQPFIRERLPELSTEESEYERRHAEEARRFGRPQSVQISPHQNLSDLAGQFDPGAALLGTATGGLPADDSRPKAETETNETEDLAPNDTETEIEPPADDDNGDVNPKVKRKNK